MAKILISDLHSVGEKEVLLSELSDEEMATIQGGSNAPAEVLAVCAVGGAVLGGPAGFLGGAFVGAILATIVASQE
ncbi:lichenicidin A2 family type 2 lantibiotic [Nostoc punctiforme]|uniref:Uncharacterized protein n=1 Tax=Nostoc punctiforme (strain ATCC 29133 / PCC 73102) TaxID=63737 RepID=B2JC36_NOSP7|nr:lichenicidin A2 family type 2 lantibiotic [Nostoc punctiforme]ACC85490.1 hypothetical protein Npun_EF023 [Nostoc punctiforme PCC 73102]